MTVLGMEGWITSAMRDEDVEKAIVLAGSLRRVYTSKKLAVLTNFGVSKKLREKLRNVFDLVVPLETVESNGLSLEESGKIEAFSLGYFKKCVYLSPNTLVLKNCDDIFEKYSGFAAIENENGIDSSVYLFTPSSVGCSQALMKLAESEGKEEHFVKCFGQWIRNNVPNFAKLDEQYNVQLSLKSGTGISLSSNLAIVNFVDIHPLDLGQKWREDNQQINLHELGAVEKFVVGLYRRIYMEDVKTTQNLYSDLSFRMDACATEPIAIVGMSFRLPGANNEDEFWDLLINGKDAIKPLPDTRWSSKHTHGPCHDRKVEAGFLDLPIDEFDAKFFGISGKEAEFLDPQQRLLHEVTWEALEDAMLDPLTLRGTQTGIFVGSWLQCYRDIVNNTLDPDFLRNYLGNSIASGAARLSHFLETTGPSIGTESGCSSAIAAVEMACKSLRNRDSNLALASGVNLFLNPFDYNTLSVVLSPDARCKTFDEEANGFVRAEGCAVLILKRLSDAVRDENKIWGLIRGSAVTQEGISKSLGTPTVHCESLAMELALKDANVDPLDVSYVEAHGTGTPVGDPLEMAAITKAYSKGRSDPLVIGSVKTNVGHTESVSGITGIIKVLLSMKHEKIPKHLNLNKLNPAINLDVIPAMIPMENMAWPKRLDRPRIAGVSSFGISGTDGHVIIQEPPRISKQEMVFDEVQKRPLHIMKVSAKSEQSLEELLTTYENTLTSKEGDDDNEEDFADLAYSANIGRTDFNHRAVIIASNSKQAVKILQDRTFKQVEIQLRGSKLCFLFTGQGSQYPKMAASLYATSPIFRSHFDNCCQVLAKRYEINMREVIWKSNDEGGAELSRTLYSQTSIFCVEYCLLQLWKSWGVKPDYVMGHSLGEFAAAVAVGALDFEDALMLVAERSRLIDNLPRGKMLVIKADIETVDKTIKNFQQVSPSFWVDYAAINSPDQTVVAGDSAMIQEFAKYCNEKSLKKIVLAATHAFHSRHMDPMLEAYRKVAQTVKPPNKMREQDAPKYISGMEGKLLELESLDAQYWVRHTREPVNFIDACKVAQSEGCSLFLEVGPHPVLSALTMMNSQGQSIPVTCLPSIRRKEDEWVTMLDSLSKLYLSDWKGEIDWKGLDRYSSRSLVPLPFYPFNRKSFWMELERSMPAVHPLLGKNIPSPCDQTIFEKKLILTNSSYLHDHVIGSTVIFPGAAFLEMCLAGGHATVEGVSSGELKKPQRPLIVKSFKIAKPLALYDSGICRLQTITKLEERDGGDEIALSVRIHRYVPSASNDFGGEWILHAGAKFLPVGQIHAPPNNVDILNIRNTWERTDASDFYERLPKTGLRFGPQFQSLQSGWKSETGILLGVQLPTEGNNNYLIHPVVADAMIQASMLWGQNYSEKNGQGKRMKLQVPVEIEKFTWLQTSDSSNRFIYCETKGNGKVDCILVDDEGDHLARMEGVSFIPTSVKVIEGMIQQQKVDLPKLWKEERKSIPGPLESSYDLTATKSVQQNNVVVEEGEVGEYEKKFNKNLRNLAKCYFLRAMYELGWEPKQGTVFTLEELWKLIPSRKEHFKRYVQYFLSLLVETGMLMVADELEGPFYFREVPPTQEEIDIGLGTAIVSSEDGDRVEYKLVVKVGKSLPQVLLGKVDPLHLLFPDDSSEVKVEQFYPARLSWLGSTILSVNDKLVSPIIGEAYEASMLRNPDSSESEPVLRILEIGGGTGLYTKPYLEYVSALGKPFEYYFTDISASFFNAAEKQFGNYSKNMVFKKLNMEEDPLAQGFCPQYFDKIVACEVIHVAKDIRKTLRSLKGLLKPGGIIQIVETTKPDPILTQIFGLLEGYWQFEDLDLRPNHVTLSSEKWERILRELDFEQVICTRHYEGIHSVITAALSPEDNQNMDIPLDKVQHSWILFSPGMETTGAKKLADELERRLAGVNRKVWTVNRPRTTLTENQMKEAIETAFSSAMEDGRRLEGIIYLWGLTDDRDQSRISLPLINLAQRMMESKVLPRLYVVTQGSANVDGFEVTHPTSGTLHGIIKSLSNESTETHISCLDLSPDSQVNNQVEEVFHSLWPTKRKGERIVAFRDGGKRYCPRLRSAKVDHNEPLTLPSGCDRFQLVLPKTRMISDLEFGVLESSTLGGNEIEVQVKAMALNFRDIFTVIKPIKDFDELNSVGLDFAGVVTRVGCQVTQRKIGDRVIGLNMDRNLSLPSHIRIKEESVVPLPTTFTYGEGVTLPAVFTTGVLCLFKVANMRRGESILIHTASGGVGLCAIQLAKHVGAEIIATAGSRRKQNYLRNLGIKHVFHSRNTHFGKQILEVTNGRGVDIVLNSLTGEGFKEASLSALARNGRFIEMSKLNVWSPEEVKELRPDVSYDLVDLTTVEGNEMLDLLAHLNEYLSNGHICPIPYEQFDAVNIRGALNYLQKAKHIGKIVCVMPELKVEEGKIKSSTPLFNEVSTYLVTGGLGGIGFEVVKWMLSSGGKHVAIVSRSTPKPEVAAQIGSWNKSGKHVEAFPVDIGNSDQCVKLFEKLKSETSGFPPLRGVMHAAGVLSDGTLANQTWNKFSHTYNPKVDGTWNLHELTKDLLLEHFVVFSSIAASIGSPGQSNHAAGNSFQDSLVAHRRSVGLPGTSVNWGQWGEVGIATEVDFPGMRPITTSQGLLALETFLKTQTSGFSVFNAESLALATKLLPSLKDHLEDKELLGEISTTAVNIINSDDFWRKMDSNADGREGKTALFKQVVCSTLQNVLKMDKTDVMNEQADFQSLGVDSLMMIEIRNGLQNILGSRMSLTVSQLKDCNSSKALANQLLTILEGGDGQNNVPTMEELRKLIREDSILPQHIQPTQEQVGTLKDISGIETVLLAGVTGTLGPYILRELSHRPGIKKIYCLVRKMGRMSCSERLLQKLKEIPLDDQVDMTKVEAIEGDVTIEKFGLSEEEYNGLGLSVDAVINSAVRSDYTAKYWKAPEAMKTDSRNVNVKGTNRILEFAVHNQLKHVFHASTMLCVVTTAGEDGGLTEDWLDVGAFDAYNFNASYPVSKHIAEQLCRQAVERGIPCKAFRFPFIGGDSNNGKGDYLTNHFLYRWLAFLKLKCMPDTSLPLLSMSVDDCARLSLELFFNPEAPPDVYNVMNSKGGLELETRSVIGIAEEEFGISIQPVPISKLLEKLKLEGDHSPLALFKAMHVEEDGMFLENPDILKFLGGLVEQGNIFQSRKLPLLLENYEGLESTDVVMRRDLWYLKDSGVFEKFGIK